MTLGRSTSGAIKIKTAPLRAVNCACCGVGCDDCRLVNPINPPTDPDFIKKLFGNDPSVTPFTQVTLAWGVASDIFDPVAYNPVLCSWPNRRTNNLGQKKIFPVNTVSGAGICGQFDDYGAFFGCESYIVGCEGGVTQECLEGKGFADFFFDIDEDTGCMRISVYDPFTDCGFWAYTKGAAHPRNAFGFSCDADDDPRVSITVNGQHYPAIVFDEQSAPDFAFANTISGFIEITFS